MSIVCGGRLVEGKCRPTIGRDSQATTLSRPGCLAGCGSRFKLTHSGSRLAGRGSTCSLSLLWVLLSRCSSVLTVYSLRAVGSSWDNLIHFSEEDVCCVTCTDWLMWPLVLRLFFFVFLSWTLFRSLAAGLPALVVVLEQSMPLCPSAWRFLVTQRFSCFYFSFLYVCFVVSSLHNCWSHQLCVKSCSEC